MKVKSRSSIILSRTFAAMFLVTAVACSSVDEGDDSTFLDAEGDPSEGEVEASSDHLIEDSQNTEVSQKDSESATSKESDLDGGMAVEEFKAGDEAAEAQIADSVDDANGVSGTDSIEGAKVSADAEPAEAEHPAQPAVETYEVAAGDTLSLIADRKFGDKKYWKEIAEANNLADPNTIVPGQKLVMPNISSIGAGKPSSAASTPVKSTTDDVQRSSTSRKSENAEQESPSVEAPVQDAETPDSLEEGDAVEEPAG